jgi:hypothetical protein
MIYLRYIPGIYLHVKSYLSIDYNACITCLGCALRYTQVCKCWRSSLLKIQSMIHFCGICLAYIIFRPVYYMHIYNSGLVIVNSQDNLEADSLHLTTHATADLSETYDMTSTHTKQVSTTRGLLCNISSLHWYIPGICLSYVISNLGFSCSTFAGSLSLPGGLCRFTPAPLADLLCFSHRETGNKRLWPAKVP